MKKNAPTSPRLVRRGPRPMALEQRFMFDGAAVAQAADTLAAQRPAADLVRIEAPLVPAAVATAEAELERALTELLSRPDAAAQLFAVFSGGQAQPSGEWAARAEAFLQSVAQDGFHVAVRLQDAGTLQGARGAFAAQGPDGSSVIYLNRDWVEDGADSESITRVLAEELGHAIDAALNPGGDTPGDEGEAFAYLLANGQLRLDAVGAGSDPGTITVDGQAVEVEFANFTFVNAYRMVYDTSGNGVVEGNLGETAAAKEQNLHNFALAGLGQVRVSDAANSPLFSGNDVSASAVTIGNVTYYGWISRPIKSNGDVKGFYFWTDTRFTSLGAAQVDGNTDGDGTTANNAGFVLVVDQAWFSAQIAATTRTTTNDIDGTAGLRAYASVGSSSDRVDSALNSLLGANLLYASPDAATLGEDTVASGNLLANDQDPNGDTITVTGYTVAGVAGARTLGQDYLIAGKGTIRVSADGSWVFTPAAHYNGPVPVITYTTTDAWGASATSTLSLSVTPVNDAPTAVNDTATVIEDTATSGTLLANDSDIDGDALTVTGYSFVSGGGSVTGTLGVDRAISGVGTVRINADGTWTFTPAAHYTGAVPVFTYTVSDGKGGTASATLTLTMAPINDAPTAAADNAAGTSYAVEAGHNVAGSTQTGNVLANDSDVDGTFTAGVTHRVTAVVAENGNTLGGATVVGRYGTLTIAADGTYAYQVNNANAAVQALNTGATLSETFTYTVRDGGGTGLAAASTLRVVIRGSNDAPVAMDDHDALQEAALAGGHYGTTTGNVLANDTDVDSSPLTIAGFSTSGITTFTTTGWPSALNSKIPGDFNQVQVQVGTGAFTTLTSNGQNVLVASLTASGSNIQVTFTDPQQLLDIAAANSGQAITIRLIQPNGTSYLGTYGSASTSGGTSALAAGTLSGKYGTLTLASNGAYTYTLTDSSLAAGQTYTEKFGYTAQDPAGATGAANLFIRVSGTAAVLADKAVVVREDTGAYISGNSTLGITTVSSFLWGGQSATAGSSITLAGVGQLTINANGSFVFDPVDDYTGAVPNALFVSTDGSAAALSIAIQAANDAPVAAHDARTVTEDTAASGNLLANDGDVDGDSLTVTGYTFVAGGSTVTGTLGADQSIAGVGTLRIDADGTWTFTPAADHTGAVPVVTYAISDGQGGTASATLTLTLAAENDPPVNTVPGTLGVSNDQALAIAGLSVADVDDNIATVSLEVAHGALGVTLSGAGAASGGGSQASPLVLTGTRAELNAMLATLVYTPPARFVGTDSLRITTTDTGGLSDTDFVALDVTADNRAVTVTGTVVNEASPYVVFQVTGAAGQWVTLELGATGTGAGHATQGLDFLPNLQVHDGSAWVDYAGGLVQIPSAANPAGVLLARAAVVQDGAFETTSSGYESLRLTATNQAGTPNTVVGALDTLAEGMAQIRDDGQGDIHKDTNTGFTPDTPGAGDAPLDDDRPVSVDSIRVNEASSYAVFTVTAQAGQRVRLSLSEGSAQVEDGSAPVRTDGAEDYGPGLEYHDPGAPGASPTGWVAYQPSTAPWVTVGAGGRLLVRTAVLPDAVYEGYQSFWLVASNTGGTAASGTAVIDDEGGGTRYPDAAPDGNGNPTTLTTGLDDDRPGFSVDDVTVNEAAGTITFTVTRSGTTLLPATVDWATAGGTAIAGADFTAGSGTLSFAANESSKTITLAIADDAVYEGPESFTVNLSDATHAVISGATGTGTVKDDGTGAVPTGVTPGDDRPGFAIDDVTVNEAAGTMTFTVTRTGQTTQASSVDWATGGGTATAGADFTAGSGTLAFAANESSKTITVAIADDAVYEGSESFSVTLSNAGGARITRATGTGTVKDDGTGAVPTGVTPDDDRPGFAIDDVTVNEAAGTMTFTVTRTGQTTQASSVDWATGGGTATAGADFTAGSGTLAFAANESSKAITVAIADDAVYEVSESFSVNLSNAGGARITRATGTGTVKDDGTGAVPTGVTPDDDRPGFAIDDVTANEAAGTMTFTVTRTGQTTQASSVDWATGGGTATAGADFTAGSGTLAFAANESSKTFTLNIADDAVYEGSESFTVTLSNAGGARITRATGTGTIKDDGTGAVPTGVTPDDDRTVAVGDIVVNEGSPHAVFTLTGSPGVPVTLALADGTATAADYGRSLETSADGGLTWTAYTGTPVALGVAGQLLVRTAVLQDTLYEIGETFALQVGVPGGMATSGSARIVDDGTGTVFRPGGSPDPTAPKDDDRQVAAAPPPAPPPAAPLAPFNSAVVLPDRSPLPVVPQRIAEPVVTERGFQVPVIVRAEPALVVNQGVTDQFVEPDREARFSLPADTFAHTRAEAMVSLSARQADGSPLPAWVKFDAQSGTFSVTPPPGFSGELKLVVLARDDEGREARAPFRMFVGQDAANGQPRVQGRPGLSEQLKLAGRKAVPLADWLGPQDGAKPGPATRPAQPAAAHRARA